MKDDVLEDRDNKKFKREISDELRRKAGLVARNVADKIIEYSVSTLYNKGISVSGSRGLAGSDYVERTGDFSFEAGFRAEHAPFVEYGTMPHMPPVNAIESWVRDRVRGGDLSLDNVKGSNKEQRIRNLAWMISMKIKREGTEAQPFFRPAVEKVKQEFDDIAERALK